MNAALTQHGAAAAGVRWRPLKALLGGTVAVPEDVEVSDLSLDSRAVRPGGAFLACQGLHQHGLRFAPQALAAGARVILWEPGPGVEPPPRAATLLSVAVPGLSAQAGFIADRFFDAPSASLQLLGVTGTNGKTTCAWLLAQALSQLGTGAAYLGTLGVGRVDALRAATHTTPDAVSLQRELAHERDAGVQAVAMEVSSHALQQQRCNGARFKIAAFSNLSRDHLDYHGSMAGYAAAKSLLFDWPTLVGRVINVDDAFGAELASRYRGSPGLVLSARLERAVSELGRHYVSASSWQADASGLSVEIVSSWGTARLLSALSGEFNIDNLLTVLGVLLALDVPLQRACEVLGNCSAPPGRMQTFGGGPLPLVVVDYAHTPDALAKALSSLRVHARGKLWCVFGCGGERDVGKRGLMGKAATELADQVIVTDDNPRNESAAAITDAIVAGAGDTTALQVIHDRATAIAHALAAANPGDVVLVAGKGHEAEQIVGVERRPFRDSAVVEAALRARRCLMRSSP
jgi:UDP-N-acetylmuramoyl-L-alanyl-D-glutamate--2,6-diaminopimelate ligase